VKERFYRFRVDFVQKIISIDDKTGEFIVSLEPDPRRYEWREINGRRSLYDKFDNVYIPEDVFQASLKTLKGKPIYFQPQKIDDAEAYIKSRQPIIENMLDDSEELPILEDKSEKFLQSLSVNKLAFVILSIDIVGSTKLSTSIDGAVFRNIIRTTLYELGDIIPKFHGYVLKYTGDGFIAYFPEPSFIAKNDLAIDCALTLRGLVYKALNPIFVDRGYPPIDVRIGFDAGEAYIETIGSPETKQYKDIIGAVVNLAVKIQSLANPGEIYLGEVAERNLHIMWRQICESVVPEEQWDYKNLDGNIYKVYKVKSK